MLGLKKLQKFTNRLIAKENKRYILKKLEEYYEATCLNKTGAKEYAVFAFWQAKKQGRLDNLNRLVKVNPNRTL